MLDVSYVHTKGTHLNFARDLNQVPVADLLNPFNMVTSVHSGHTGSTRVFSP